MYFDSGAYAKLFPPTKNVVPHKVESMVENFKADAEETEAEVEEVELEEENVGEGTDGAVSE